MNSRKTLRSVDIFRDEKGITTTAMAVSIMVSLALIFTGAQVYKSTSVSAEVQEVADACALAAESEVAEFMVCVKTCDATVLSLSLLAGTTFGLGIVCACVPPLKAVSDSLVKIGNKALKARNDFAKKAAKGLNKLQSALPFFAAASAMSVARANNSGAMPGDYIGYAFLIPQKGKKIEIGSLEDLEDVAKNITDDVSVIQGKAADAEEAAKEAQKAKKDAYDLDCGNAPGYCQYERAARFSWMPKSENPFYSNIDAWSFSIAFNRAKSYYAYREGREEEPIGSVADKASYFVRMKFYSYAYEKLESEGYVNESASSFSANFPKLYKNTSEFRQTSLYTSASFPVSYEDDAEKGVMHAWEGCPNCFNADAYDRIAALDAGVYTGCQICNFSVESLGNVASASTNISNGFEYHYDRIRQHAEKYQEAMNRVSPLSKEVKEMADPLFDSLIDSLKNLGNYRIDADPCGGMGAVSVVMNKAHMESDLGFESMFVERAGEVGTRVAVSGAALLEDASDDSANVISTLLDGFAEEGGAVLGGARIALDCWSGLLKAYEKGQKSLEKTLSNTISSLSLGTLSGIGDWAAKALKDAMKDVGLEPANLNALKPAILNTGHIASASDDSLAVNYRKVRSKALSVSSPNGTLFSGIFSQASDSIGEMSGREMIIAEIEFPIGGKKIPISISIPGSVSSIAKDSLLEGIKRLESMIIGPSQEKVWQ